MLSQWQDDLWEMLLYVAVAMTCIGGASGASMEEYDHDTGNKYFLDVCGAVAGRGSQRPLHDESGRQAADKLLAVRADDDDNNDNNERDIADNDNGYDQFDDTDRANDASNVNIQAGGELCAHHALG